MITSEDIKVMLDKLTILQGYAKTRPNPGKFNSFYTSILDTAQKTYLPTLELPLDPAETVYSIHAHNESTLLENWSNNTIFSVFHNSGLLNITTSTPSAPLDEFPQHMLAVLSLKLKLDPLRFLDHTVAPERRRILYRPKQDRLEIVIYLHTDQDISQYATLMNRRLFQTDSPLLLN